MEEPSAPDFGQRYATVLLNLGFVSDINDPAEAEADPDSEWLVREWDGQRWREVGRVQGRAAADRLVSGRLRAVLPAT